MLPEPVSAFEMPARRPESGTQAPDRFLSPEGRDVRKELAHFDAAPAMLFEFPRRLHQPADVSLREGERSLERKRLAVIPNQPRLGVERIDARWAAVHEEKDHALGLWLEMGSLRSEGIVTRL